jgi:hypothetical protein
LIKKTHKMFLVLALAAKVDVYRQREAYCSRGDVNRRDDLIRWGSGGGICFPFLEYELASPGGSIVATKPQPRPMIQQTPAVAAPPEAARASAETLV